MRRTSRGFVGGYDPKGGQELWRVRYGEGYSVVPCPVLAHGMLFLSSGFDRPVAYAIRPQGAKGDVSKTHVAWTYAKGAPATPSMVVVGDADEIRPEHAVELFRLLGGGVPGDTLGVPEDRLVVLPGTTHVGVAMTAPAWLAPTITPFLDEPAGATG